MFIHKLSYIVQFLILFSLTFYSISRSLNRSTIHMWQHLEGLKKLRQPPRLLCNLLLINPSKLNDKHQTLFSQTGFNISYLYYLLIYRFTFLFMLIGTSTLFFILKQFPLKNGVLILMITFIIVVVLACERIWLKLWIAYRKKQIIYDLYQLSYHLLYFTDSQMNIYGKLQRCLPYTSAIKRDLQLLLLSWTQNSDEALQQFRNRLGCREAISFVDTIQALKQHQDETFYSLLRERIEEYKEQLDIASNSKKETSSYILFVLAGIPILYTFQVFIYPWVKEVQNLLQSMN